MRIHNQPCKFRQFAGVVPGAVEGVLLGVVVGVVAGVVDGVVAGAGVVGIGAAGGADGVVGAVVVSLAAGGGSAGLEFLLLSSQADKAKSAKPVRKIGRYFCIFSSFYRTACYWKNQKMRC